MSTKHLRMGAGVALVAALAVSGWGSRAVAADGVKKTKHQKAAVNKSSSGGKITCISRFNLYAIAAKVGLSSS